jgi:hypothetical protein
VSSRWAIATNLGNPDPSPRYPALVSTRGNPPPPNEQQRPVGTRSFAQDDIIVVCDLKDAQARTPHRSQPKTKRAAGPRACATQEIGRPRKRVIYWILRNADPSLTAWDDYSEGEELQIFKHVLCNSALFLPYNRMIDLRDAGAA